MAGVREAEAGSGCPMQGLKGIREAFETDS